jgi:hypothetical protein
MCLVASGSNMTYQYFMTVIAHAQSLQGSAVVEKVSMDAILEAIERGVVEIKALHAAKP